MGIEMIAWQWLEFESIPRGDLYEVLRQRQEVFVLEQACLYPDLDGHDEAAHHLMAWQATGGERRLVAYLRCLAPGAKYEEMSIGRVVTSPGTRGTGLGRELVAQGLALARKLHPGHAIRIGAQAHLETFYAGFGFRTVSAPYDEDGILHIDMLRPAAGG
jgi:ElaA protein